MSANFFFLHLFFTSLGKPTFDITSFILGHFTLGRCPFYSQCPVVSWPQVLLGPLMISISIVIKVVNLTWNNFNQKCSRLRYLLLVKGLVICLLLGWSGSTLQIRNNVIQVGSKPKLPTCSSNTTLSLPAYTVSAL